MTSSEPPPSTATTVTDAAFEIVTLLPGLTTVGKRGGDLDGNLPVRAARYCGPVFEGSAAGFQVTLGQPMNGAAPFRAGRGGSVPALAVAASAAGLAAGARSRRQGGDAGPGHSDG